MREKLPRDFTDGWDGWWQRGLAETQARWRDGWQEAWLEAPVWRFMLPPGLCGKNGMLGLWLPSVDKVGRYSPLTIAAAAPCDWLPHVGEMTSFLAAAEEAGRDALEYDLTPADLLERIQAAFAVGEGPASELGFVPGCAAWWTEGGPRVVARFEVGTALPEGNAFAALIDDDWGTSAAAPEALAPRASDAS
ncbi:MAG: type VI secretion system-associated protein TagF [Rhodospirillales bacterium]|nr:type VI secretion system-associated protein TagF [Rhodospirillales bacterium]